MQNDSRVSHATMASPSAGFASRVMARIEERERAQARRRAAIGTVLLVAAALAPFVLVGVWIGAWIGALLTSPGTIVTALTTVSPVLSDLANALWIATLAIVQNTNGAMLVAYASFVLALTVVWARVVTGPFQPSSTVSLGGQ